MKADGIGVQGIFYAWALMILDDRTERFKSISNNYIMPADRV